MDEILRLETVLTTIVDMAMFNQQNTYDVNPLIKAIVLELYWLMVKRSGQCFKSQSYGSDKFD